VWLLSGKIKRNIEMKNKKIDLTTAIVIIILAPIPFIAIGLWVLQTLFNL